MARWGIGDVQGCCAELRELLTRIDYSADRDQLWFTGDLVNRGPESLPALRLVRSLDANAIVVLGNHDLHLLAAAFVPGHRLRAHDTLDEILVAPDREALLAWLLARPLLHYSASHQDLLVHAGVLPQWDAPLARALAGEVEAALRHDPRALLRDMYGDKPDRWDPALKGTARLRLIINVCTRLRFCTPDGRIDLKQKGRPDAARAPWFPWYLLPERASRGTRIIFGHWSALGFYRKNGVLCLDTGCVWGGSLTAVNLDEPDRPPVSVPARSAVPLHAE
ncbi:MAG TPA: symmetrical bis(5'-nucleosyl)-tetraphosphatase [Steroidobacteraceae bacterium]